MEGILSFPYVHTEPSPSLSFTTIPRRQQNALSNLLHTSSYPYTAACKSYFSYRKNDNGNDLAVTTGHKRSRKAILLLLHTGRLQNAGVH